MGIDKSGANNTTGGIDRFFGSLSRKIAHFCYYISTNAYVAMYCVFSGAIEHAAVDQFEGKIHQQIVPANGPVYKPKMRFI